MIDLGDLGYKGCPEMVWVIRALECREYALWSMGYSLGGRSSTSMYRSTSPSMAQKAS